MNHDKQSNIVQIIRQRIADNVYRDLLPTGAELAAEFGVNIKTLDKALKKLVRANIIERKRHAGSRVKKQIVFSGPKLPVEVIFEGYATLFTHPFWADIWAGALEVLTAMNFKVILNILEADAATGLLKLDNFGFCDSAGKIALGIEEHRVLNLLKTCEVPFITACDVIDDAEIPQITFDFTAAIAEAVDYLRERGCRKIGFIGQTSHLVNAGVLHKYNAYLKAVQRYDQIDPALIQNVRPNDLGPGALEELLNRTPADAVIAAFDHQLPAMYRTLSRRKQNLPLIGCDGLRLDGVPAGRCAVAAPRKECGRKLASELLKAIAGNRLPQSAALPAVFCHPGR